MPTESQYCQICVHYKECTNTKTCACDKWKGTCSIERKRYRA